jgi:hypothetical protein
MNGKISISTCELTNEYTFVKNNCSSPDPTPVFLIAILRK